MISLKSNIAKSAWPHFKPTARHTVERGGRFSTKTTRNSFRVVLELLQDNRCEAVAIRNNYKDHRTSTVRELLMAFERIGCTVGSKQQVERKQAHVYVSKTDLKIVMWTGQEIQFGAINDAAKLKGFVPSSEDRFFGVLWFVELAEFRNKADMDVALLTFIRQKKPFFFVLYEFNTHPLRSHWTHDWFNTMRERPDAVVIESTYLDLTEWEQVNWIGPAALEEAEIAKQYQPDVYEHMYLGKERKLDGSVYKSFGDHLIYDLEYNANEYSVGIDYGARDAVSAVLTGMWGATHSHRFDQYYHKNAVGNHKTIVAIAKELDAKLTEWSNTTGKYIIARIDSANADLIDLMEEHANQHGIYMVEAVDKGKTDPKALSAIQERIDWTCLMQSLGRWSVSPKCVNLINEMDAAMYTSNNVRADDANHLVDSIDSDEYSTKHTMAMSRAWALTYGIKEEHYEVKQK